MKNQLRVLRVRIFPVFLISLLTIFNAWYLRGQITYVPTSTTTSYHDTYPGTPGNPQWMARSCFSFGNAAINGNNYDLFLSAWRDANNAAHIVWRAMDVSLPLGSTGLDQEFTIPSTTNIQNISVGIISDGSGGYKALVAYNNVGTTGNVGVVLNIYDVQTTALLNSTPTSTTVLYSKANYTTRVCMDSRQEVSAVVWNEIDPNTSGTVIKCLPIAAGSFGSPVLLDNTDDNINADVAILYNTDITNPVSGVNLHFVSFNTSTSELTESMENFNIVLGASLSGFIIYPTIEDVNTLSPYPANLPRPTIDCPSTFGSENWAYAYTTAASSNDIYVRLVDIPAGVTPTTIVLTDGSLGNTAINTNDNTWQTLVYGIKAQDFYVGWQTVGGGATNNFVCTQVSSDGSTLLSTSDYLLLSPSATNWPNGVLLCKNNEAPYLYAIYSSQNNLGANLINHQFHYWTTTASSFKAEAKNSLINYDISAFPNPFSNLVSFNVSSALMNETIKASLTDVLGRTVFSRELQGRDLNDMVNDYLPKILPGSYWLKISKPSFKYSQLLPLVKIGK